MCRKETNKMKKCCQQDGKSSLIRKVYNGIILLILISLVAGFIVVSLTP